MANSPFAWGIDIGKCGLKAIRGRVSPTDPRKFVVDVLEYVEYPTMLPQAGPEAASLVQAAITELLSRHDLDGDRVAVAAPGQAGLAKFIKLPPIEARKVPDIVRYEANQQIPFPLDQVVWDWQRLAGGIEESGFLMDAEVALFAMKREQVSKAIAPLVEAGVEVDLLQLQPIALANMVIFDQLPDPATIDPDNPPASIVLVSIGVESTDIVVTNGLKVAQRSMPIGGNSFTKALVKEFKYTFAKAEQEKRNAVRAADPRAVFKAMRPVFEDFASELQRSLTYFGTSDKALKIGKVLLLGSAAKLRGLADFVGKQLGIDVQRLEAYSALEGTPASGSPVFREHRLAFGTAYGLALQAAGGGAVRTNLVPREMIRDRIIAAKKPWAVAAMLGLLTAAVVNFGGLFLAWQTFAPGRFAQAFAAADGAKTRSAAAVSAFEESKRVRDEAVQKQRYFLDVNQRRFQALDLMRAVTSLLPRDEEGKVPGNPADRNEIHVDAFEMEYFADLGTWFETVKAQWQETLAAAGGETPPAIAADEGAATQAPGTPSPDAAAPPADPAAVAAESAEAAGAVGPKGPGWVVQITGHHYRNEDRHKPLEGEQYVRSTLLHNLLGKGQPVVASAGPLVGKPVTVADLGIGYPVIVLSPKVRTEEIIDPNAGAGLAARPGMAPGQDGAAGALSLKRYDFILQFAWQPAVPGVPKPPTADQTAATAP